MSHASRRIGGFTLIELLVAVAILGILASVALPVAESTRRFVVERELREALRTIRGALDRYKAASDAGHIPKAADASGYPPRLSVLVDGVVDAKDPAGRRLYFLRRVPRNPLAASHVPADRSWGLRSYRSPPDDPQPGEDVYDVHASVSTVGSNGVAYARW